MMGENQISTLSIPLERDAFLRDLIRELSGLLEDVVGLEEASGFISVVGQQIGNQINEQYRSALHLDQLSENQVATVLVDLKKRIKGDFYIIEQNKQKVILGNRACPFAEKVIDRPSLCMMTSNVFGTITAENTGYGKVVLENTIAKGDHECKIVIHFDPENKEINGREYFKAGD